MPQGTYQDQAIADLKRDPVRYAATVQMQKRLLADLTARKRAEEARGMVGSTDWNQVAEAQAAVMNRLWQLTGSELGECREPEGGSR